MRCTDSDRKEEVAAASVGLGDRDSTPTHTPSTAMVAALSFPRLQEILRDGLHTPDLLGGHTCSETLTQISSLSVLVTWPSPRAFRLG